LHNDYVPWPSAGAVESFVRNISSAYFVESPPGMGSDCYRHYEAMLVGAIPVVSRTSLSYPVFEGLPHLPVDDWNDVTPEFIGTQRDLLFRVATKPSFQ
jgi:hypothetical protein